MVVPLPPPESGSTRPPGDRSPWRRRYRTDYRMWGRLFALFFLPPFLGASVLTALDLWYGHRIDTPLLVVFGELGLAGAAALSWLIQALLVMGGSRLPDRRPDPEAADYDDGPPAGGVRLAESGGRLPSDEGFTLDDFRRHLDNLRRMGFTNLIDRSPVMAGLIPAGADPDAALDGIRAMIDAMTADERAHPERIDPPATRRIAADAGTEPADVQDLVRRFGEVRVMMRRLTHLTVWERLKLVLGLTRFPPPP